jgi:hypothetical protein
MVRMIRLSFLNIKLIIPWILRAFWRMLYVMFLVALSLWTNIPLTVDRTAANLVTEATGKNLPTSMDNSLYWVSCGVAVIEIMLVWIFLSYVTMLLLGILF